MDVKEKHTPAVADFIQWNGHGFLDGPPAWLLAAIQSSGTPDKLVGAALRMRGEVHIGTRFGVMVAHPRDWIVLHEGGEIAVLSDYELALSGLSPPMSKATTSTSKEGE